MWMERPSYPDHRTRRMYPDDPVRELCRLKRRAERLVTNGLGSFGRPDVDMMHEVIGEIMEKMKRLAFLEGKLGEMA